MRKSPDRPSLSFRSRGDARVLACGVVLLLVGGCDDQVAERCNERGGVYANTSTYDRSYKGSGGNDWHCFRPDTISLAIPRPAERP